MALREKDIHGSLQRYLETDLLLGVEAAPLKAPSRKASRSAASVGKARRPAPTSGGTQVIALQAVSAEETARREQALKALNEKMVRNCKKCPLSRTRNKTVFGQGNAAARLVFVGEAPGAEEDAQGLAFVGRAGQLLTKMIEAMGLTRDQVYICNILKCRPPNNRDPAPDEIACCWPYLDEQLRIIQPEVIVALGRPAAQTLLRTTASIGQLRGQWHDYFISGSPMVGPATPLMPTYHPAYLLRNPPDKVKAWNDLKMVMARLGLPIPQR
jgi:uracil-DNA glycosylase family 4